MPEDWLRRNMPRPEVQAALNVLAEAKKDGRFHEFY